MCVNSSNSCSLCQHKNLVISAEFAVYVMMSLFLLQTWQWASVFLSWNSDSSGLLQGAGPPEGHGVCAGVAEGNLSPGDSHHRPAPPGQAGEREAPRLYSFSETQRQADCVL